jgi:hypothetical protein
MNIDRISNFVIEPHHLLGLFLLIVAGISISTGKTLTRGHGLVSRAKEPVAFWGIVAISFVIGILCVGDFLPRK